MALTKKIPVKVLTVEGMLLENYKGVQSFNQQFGKTNLITGHNGTGKSTLYDAYTDILSGKMSDGSTTDNVRPHDKNGVDIDKVPVDRTITVSIDGTVSELKKSTVQDWKVARGTKEEVFNGNKTQYAINGFAKKANEFTAFTEDIAPQETLLMCSSARPFLNLAAKSTVNARKLLERLSGFDSKDLLDSPEYADIKPLLEDETVEDAIRKLKKDQALQKQKLSGIEANIQYMNQKALQVPDTSAIDSQIKDLQTQIDSMQIEYQTNKVFLKKREDLLNQIAELKAKKEEIIATVNAEAKKANEAALKEYRNAGAVVAQKEHDAEMLYRDLTEVQHNVTSAQVAIDNEREELDNLKAQKFVPNKSKICEYSGAACEFIENRMKAINAEKRKEFEADIKKQMDDRKAMIKAKTEELKAAESELKEAQNKYDKAKADATKARNDYGNLSPEAKGLQTETAETKEIDKQIAALEAKFREGNTIADRNEEIRATGNGYARQISALKEQKASMISVSENAKTSVAELTTQNEEESKRLGEIASQIQKLNDFSNAKNKALSEAVNKHFRYINFKLFDTTQDGNEFETLKIMVGGTDYMNGLNHGARILADVDLVRGLQDMNHLNMPIWVDDAESVDEEAIPTGLEQQLFILRRTDEANLTVKVVEK